MDRTLADLQRVLNRRDWDDYPSIFAENAFIYWLGVFLTPAEALMITARQEGGALRTEFSVKHEIGIPGGVIVFGSSTATYADGRTLGTTLEAVIIGGLIRSLSFCRDPEMLRGVVQWVEPADARSQYYKIDLIPEGKPNRIRIWCHETFVERAGEPEPKQKIEIDYWTVYGGEGRSTYNIVEALAGYRIL